MGNDYPAYLYIRLLFKSQFACNDIIIKPKIIYSEFPILNIYNSIIQYKVFPDIKKLTTKLLNLFHNNSNVATKTFLNMNKFLTKVKDKVNIKVKSEIIYKILYNMMSIGQISYTLHSLV